MRRYHPIPFAATPRASAEQYQALLRQFFDGPSTTLRTPPRFDLILLGLGEDGHTASLFPNTPALEERRRWVSEVYLAGQEMSRVTLTVPLINQARWVVFLVNGAAKAGVLRDVVEGGPEVSLPARLIRPVQGELDWYVDRAAGRRAQSSKNIQHRPI